MEVLDTLLMARQGSYDGTTETKMDRGEEKQSWKRNNMPELEQSQAPNETEPLNFNTA